jgi:hypothetical protein
MTANICLLLICATHKFGHTSRLVQPGLTVQRGLSIHECIPPHTLHTVNPHLYLS